MVAASSSYGAIAAFADDEYAVSQATLDAMAEDYYTIEPIDSEMLSFSDYYDIYSGENRPDTETVVSASSYSSASGGGFSVGSYGPEDDNRDDVLLWESTDGSVTYDINIEETGIYCVNMTYCPMISNSSDIELSMTIDGELPYDTASRITLSRVWVNEQEI